MNSTTNIMDFFYDFDQARVETAGERTGFDVMLSFISSGINCSTEFMHFLSCGIYITKRFTTSIGASVGFFRDHHWGDHSCIRKIMIWFASTDSSPRSKIWAISNRIAICTASCFFVRGRPFHFI
jgi:hypothetical protein